VQKQKNKFHSLKQKGHARRHENFFSINQNPIELSCSTTIISPNIDALLFLCTTFFKFDTPSETPEQENLGMLINNLNPCPLFSFSAFSLHSSDSSHMADR